MAEEVLRLGVNPAGAVAGFKKYDAAARGSELASDRVAMAVGAAGAAMVAFGGARQVGAAVRGLSELETAVAEVSTLLSDTSDVEAMTASVRALSEEYGGANVEKARALYDIISAGASDAAEATSTLAQANRLAIGGVTGVSIAADGLTSILNAYGEAAGGAASVSDAMFVAMRAGKTTVGELSQSIGQVAPIAAQAGVSLEEVLSATAALTKGGIATSESMRGVRQIIASILKPTSEAADEAERLGVKFNATALETRGLSGLLDDLVRANGGSAESMAQLFGGVEALVPVLALTGTGAKDFTEILASMDDRAGSTEAAVEKMSDTLQFKISQATAEFVNWREEMADNVVPALEFVLDHSEEVADGLTSVAIAAGATGAAGAFVVLGPTVVGATGAFLALVPAINSVGAAVALLQIAIGPAGWLVLGVSTLTAATYTLRRAQREHTEDLTAYRDRMSEAADEMGRLGEAATLSTLQGLTAGLSEASAEVARLKAALEEAQGGTSFGSAREVAQLHTQLGAAEERVSALGNLLVAASGRWVTFGTAADDAAGQVDNVTAAVTDLDAALKRAARLDKAIAEQADALARAAERLMEAEPERIARLAEGFKRLAESVRDVAPPVEDITDAVGDANRRVEQLLEAFQRGPRSAEAIANTLDLIRQRLAASGLTEGDLLDPFQREIDQLAERLAELLGIELPDAADAGAANVERAWLGALRSVAGEVDGLGGALLDIGSAFLSGGIHAAGAAAFGGLMGLFSNQEDQQQRRLAEEMNEQLRRVADGLDSYADRLEGMTSAQITAFRVAQDMIESGKLGDVKQGFLSGRDIRTSAEFFGLDYEAVLADPALAARLAAMIEEAIAEAARQVQEQLNSDFAIRRLELDGRDVEAARARRRAAADAEIDELTRLANAGLIATDQFTEFVAVIEDELVQALREAQEAAEEAARVFAEDLYIRGLTATGQGDSAARARLDAAHRREWRDARSSGVDPNQLAFLGFVQQAERQSLELQQALRSQTDAITAALNEQLAALDAQRKVAEEELRATQESARTTERSIAEIGRIIGGIDAFQNSLTVGSSSPLAPLAQLRSAEDQYNALYQLALGGDRSAASSFTSAAKDLLAAQEAVTGRNTDYFDVFFGIQSAMEAVKAEFVDEKTMAEQHLEELQVQSSSLRDQIASLEAAKDQARENAQAQINALQAAFDAEMDILRQQLDAMARELGLLEDLNRKWDAFDWDPDINIDLPDTRPPDVIVHPPIFDPIFDPIIAPVFDPEIFVNNTFEPVFQPLVEPIVQPPIFDPDIFFNPIFEPHFEPIFEPRFEPSFSPQIHVEAPKVPFELPTYFNEWGDQAQELTDLTRGTNNINATGFTRVVERLERVEQAVNRVATEVRVSSGNRDY